jgi:glycosyltransferase involved in cell wall biosynthesis
MRAVGVAAQGPISPAFRIRLDLPRAELRRHGVDLALEPLFDEAQERRFRGGSGQDRLAALLAARRSLSRRLTQHADVDVVVVQRQVDLLPTLALERQATDGRRFVLDVDDAIWLDASRRAGGHPLAVLKGTRRKLAWLARRAAGVTVGNELLAEHIGRYTDAVTVLPSVVDLDSVPLRAHQPTEPVVLGWIGSGTTARYLQALAPTLALLPRAGRPSRFEVHTVGADLDPIPGVRVVSRPWSPGEERDLLGRMDIGLMPLPDDLWTRGKCAYKALQYMAAGVPVVADPVGVSAEIVGQRAGILARSREEWLDALVALARDPALRVRLGAEGRARVERDYSLQRWAPVLARLLTGS